jgi:DNA-binding CsgD family transcriptional regulator
LTDPHPGDLTSREIEVIKPIAAALSNTEIAAALLVSAATIKTHINHIFQKTGARGRAQAVRYAYQHGLACHPVNRHPETLCARERSGDGALMEQSGRNRWKEVANRSGPRRARTSRNRCRRLSPLADDPRW